MRSSANITPSNLSSQNSNSTENLKEETRKVSNTSEFEVESASDTNRTPYIKTEETNSELDTHRSTENRGDIKLIAENSDNKILHNNSEKEVINSSLCESNLANENSLTNVSVDSLNQSASHDEIKNSDQTIKSLKKIKSMKTAAVIDDNTLSKIDTSVKQQNNQELEKSDPNVPIKESPISSNTVKIESTIDEPQNETVIKKDLAYDSQHEEINKITSTQNLDMTKEVNSEDTSDKTNMPQVKSSSVVMKINKKQKNSGKQIDDSKIRETDTVLKKNKSDKEEVSMDNSSKDDQINSKIFPIVELQKDTNEVQPSIREDYVQEKNMETGNKNNFEVENNSTSTNEKMVEENINTEINKEAHSGINDEKLEMSNLDCDSKNNKAEFLPCAISETKDSLNDKNILNNEQSPVEEIQDNNKLKNPANTSQINNIENPIDANQDIKNGVFSVDPIEEKQKTIYSDEIYDNIIICVQQSSLENDKDKINSIANQNENESKNLDNNEVEKKPDEIPEVEISGKNNENILSNKTLNNAEFNSSTSEVLNCENEESSKPYSEIETVGIMKEELEKNKLKTPNIADCENKDESKEENKVLDLIESQDANFKNDAETSKQITNMEKIVDKNSSEAITKSNHDNSVVANENLNVQKDENRQQVPNELINDSNLNEEIVSTNKLNEVEKLSIIDKNPDSQVNSKIHLPEIEEKIQPKIILNDSIKSDEKSNCNILEDINMTQSIILEGNNNQSTINDSILNSKVSETKSQIIEDKKENPSQIHSNDKEKKVEEVKVENNSPIEECKFSDKSLNNENLQKERTSSNNADLQEPINNSEKDKTNNLDGKEKANSSIASKSKSNYLNIYGSLFASFTGVFLLGYFIYRRLK